ncbi:MAG: septal ring lytic transglycosylase RlpA family protein [Ignavibacteria bacterium]|nr:septal ring lytic transglycosylase RlpA family protein [Ignavibacteria bacterium]
MSICSRFFVDACSALSMGLILVGCASAPRFATRSNPPSPQTESTAETTKSEKTRPPRNPTGKILLTLEGVASYYADDYHGKQTSNGEIFDMNELTAAHRTLPFGTTARVTNLENKKTVVVRINDRGPFKEGRIIDLSLAAAKELDLIRMGTARVRIEVLEWGDGS